MNDLRQTWRTLLRNPGYTAVAITTLALGIGANVAIFSFLDQLLLRPLPVRDPHELAVVALRYPDHTTYTFNYPLYRDYRDGADLLAGLAACQEQSVSLTVDELTERTRALVVTENYFEMLGVPARLGRTLDPKLDAPVNDLGKVVISYGLWQRRFASDPNIAGRVVRLNSQPFAIVGVAPPEFNGTLVAFSPEIYIPIHQSPRLRLAAMFDSNALEARYHTWLNLLGRLKPGVSRKQAELQLQTLTAHIAKEHPDSTATEIVLLDGSQGHNQRVTRASVPLFLLQVVVALLLLAGCANLANLLLARAHGRRKELAIRLALGATRRRIIRHMLTESVLLALAGGLAGLLVATWLTSFLATFHPPGSPTPVSPGLDGRTLMFALLISVATGGVFSLLPAWKASQPGTLEGLKTGAADTGSGQLWNLRSLLVTCQVALSVLVLIAAGLCLRSAHKANTVLPGFEPTRVLLASIDLEAAGKHEPEGRQFFQQLLQRVRSLPGVEAAGLARTVVLSGSGSRISIHQIQDHPGASDESLAFEYNIISPDYFRALGVPFLRGRDFNERDGPEAPRVVIINDVLAQRYWPDQDPIGKRISVPRMVAPPPGANSGSIRTVGEDAYEIIGVVRSGKYRSLTEEPTGMMFWALSQQYEPRLSVHLRAKGDPKTLLASVRTSIRELDRYLPVFNVRTLEEQRVGSLFLQRMAATLLSGFGALALLLAALGVYGVMSYAVGCRTREIGIRLALGAQVSDVLRMILRQGMTLTAVGLSVGLAGALATTHVLRSFLYGISPVDPLTFAGLALVLGGVGVLACWLPARRAAKLDPMTALRSE